jgi:formamidopyrimidine-DNA glycosylase
MPELPEVETIARGLDRHLRDRTIVEVQIIRADVIRSVHPPIATSLPGRVVRDVGRRGKHVILRLDTGASLVFHLGMSGRLKVCGPDEPAAPHTHVRMSFDRKAMELRFLDPRRFGGIWFLEPPASVPVPAPAPAPAPAGDFRTAGDPLAGLGVEPLEMSPATFRRLLGRRRQIKALLMDQQVVAGLGNIYCDESLHQARIHPQTRAEALDAPQCRRLYGAIRSVLRRAIRHGGSTMRDYVRADGRAGSFRAFHRVYQREGEPCQTCGTAIRRIIAAGRSTFYCPKCQL